jgi:hypothetical protein
MAESPNSVIWVTQITEYPNIWLFGWPEYPNNQIFSYSVILTKFGDSVFFGFVPIIRKIGELHSKLNSVNPHPCQSVCWSLCQYKF